MSDPLTPVDKARALLADLALRDNPNGRQLHVHEAGPELRHALTAALTPPTEPA